MSLTGMELFNRLMPTLGIVTGVLMSLVVTQRRSEARNAVDAARLRAGLQVELAMLRSAYQDSLTQLAAGAELLPSWRAMTTLYRANLNRLTLLDEAEVAAVVAAYGHVDVVEGYLATACKPIGQVYRVLRGETPIDTMRERICTVQAHITAALGVLAPFDQPEAAQPPSYSTAVRTSPWPEARAAKA